MPTKSIRDTEVPEYHLAQLINPATIYVVFRAIDKRQIKARLAANGCSIGKSRNAELAFISCP